MSTITVTTTYAHTVNYVTEKILYTLKDIILKVGLSPSKFAGNWAAYQSGLSTWMASQHLEKITLEIYNPTGGALVSRWDLDIVYSTIGDGSLWVDADAIRYSIQKAGAIPAFCDYKVLVETREGRPDIQGWSECSYRSTQGFTQFGVGSSVGGTGVHGQTSYWSK